MKIFAIHSTQTIRVYDRKYIATGTSISPIPVVKSSMSVDEGIPVVFDGTR
jgi:hypothetical protein